MANTPGKSPNPGGDAAPPEARTGAGELTAELRWWWRGAAPGEIAAWFAAGMPAEPETRTDTYWLAGNAALGIKQRGSGAGIEVKSLVAPLAVDLPGGAAELWVKHAAPAGDLPPGPGLAVAKCRRLRQLTLAQNGGLGTCDGGAPDIQLELGTVHAGDGPEWTSLCFEARTSLEAPARILLAAWQLLAPPQACSSGLAASYPAWLERFARG